MSSFIRSEEQEDIINKVLEGNNLLIVANAGASKSTTCIEIAKSLANTNKRIAIYTLSSLLKKEMREKVSQVNLELIRNFYDFNQIPLPLLSNRSISGIIKTLKDNLDLEVSKLIPQIKMDSYSYGSYATAVYNEKAYDTKGMLEIIDNDTPPKANVNYSYDIVILDEKQDDSLTSYRFQLKFLRDIDILKRSRDITGPSYPQLICLGDPFQLIFQSMGADERFLTMANQLYPSPRPWTNPKLTISFRFHDNIARLVNALGKRGVPLRGNPMAVKEKIRYIKYSPRTRNKDVNSDIFISIIRKYLGMGISPSEILILAQNVSNNPLINSLVSKLVQKGIPVYRSSKYEATVMDESEEGEIMSNKIQILSYTKSKGITRKVVIIIDYDSSFFSLYQKDEDPNLMPNAHYVALTRASKYLILCQSSDFDQVPYAPSNLITKYSSLIDYEDLSTEPPKSMNQMDRPQITSVDKLLEFTHPDSIIICNLLFSNQLTCINPPNNLVEEAKILNLSEPYISSNIGGTNILEPVSMLNEIALTTFLEYDVSSMKHYSYSRPPYYYREGWNNDYFLVKNPPLEYNKNLEITRHRDEVSGIDYLLDKDRIPFIIDNKGNRLYRNIFDVYKFNEGIKIDLDASDYLKIANVYYANTSGRRESLYQINEYKWLGNESFNWVKSLLFRNGVNYNSIYNIPLRYRSHTFDKIIITTELNLLCESMFYELKVIPNDLITDVNRIQFLLKILMFFQQNEDPLSDSIPGDIVDYLGDRSVNVRGEVIGYKSMNELIIRSQDTRGKSMFLPINISLISRNWVRNEQISKYDMAKNYLESKGSTTFELKPFLNKLYNNLSKHTDKVWYPMLMTSLKPYNDILRVQSVQGTIINLASSRMEMFNIPIFIIKIMMDVILFYKSQKIIRMSDKEFINNIKTYLESNN